MPHLRGLAEELLGGQQRHAAGQHVDRLAGFRRFDQHLAAHEIVTIDGEICHGGRAEGVGHHVHRHRERGILLIQQVEAMKAVTTGIFDDASVKAWARIESLSGSYFATGIS